MKKLEVVTCSIPRDLPLTCLALNRIKKFFDVSTISVVMPFSAFPEGRRLLGSDVELLDERDLAGGLSLADLQTRTRIHGFPARAGWYMQQLVKLGFAFHGDPDGYYLIWDCDTIPLRSLDFFTADDRPIYTLADEKHAPYFQTYERLLGTPPPWQGSFISQHMIVKRKVAREMLEEIAARHPLHLSWNWAIMDNLAPVESLSLFSEYETYGNFVHSRYPASIAFRRLPWLRDGSIHAGTTKPSEKQLDKLARQYYFAAFEAWQLPTGSWA
jgi:hypothetical protein